jgi:hypothetical protein
MMLDFLELHLAKQIMIKEMPNKLYQEHDYTAT